MNVARRIRATVLVGTLVATSMAASAVGAEDSPDVPGTRPAEARLTAAGTVSTNAVEPIVTESGRVTLAVDAVGTNDAAGDIAVIEKPTGAAVRRAYLLAASTGFSGYRPVTGDVKIDGTAVAWDTAFTIPNSIGSYNVAADVTEMIRTKAENTFGPAVEFVLAEGTRTADIDGSILAVIWDDPTATQVSTVVLMYGAQEVTGDAISLARPATGDDVDLELSLGISFGFQPAGQYSLITVNGTRLSSSAGGHDDGEPSNGALITVGGWFDYPQNPTFPDLTDNDCFEPAPRCDDELYDLTTALSQSSSSTFVVETENPSGDDNIFFAAVTTRGTTLVLGEGIIASPPQQIGAPFRSKDVEVRVVGDDGSPRSGVVVDVNTIEGPNQGGSITAVTGADGSVSVPLISAVTGTDVVEASFAGGDGQEITSSPVTIVWVEPRDHVILGDSYSSGEGADFYDENTDREGNKCHRSGNAWGPHVSLQADVPLRLLQSYACSGGVTKNFLTETQYDEPAPQLDRAGITPDLDLVTFTIGGNDVGFSDVVKICIWRNDCTNGRYRIPGTNIGGSVVDSTNARIDDLEFTLGGLYLDLLGRVSPETSVWTSSYPHLVENDDFCGKLSFFGPAEKRFFRSGVNRMASRIESASTDAGIHFFDAREAFTGHEVCGSQGEWINGVSRTIVHSFHPNVDGQVGWSSAIRARINGMVESGVPLNAAGLPLNPQPGVPFVAASARAGSALAAGDVLVIFDSLDVEIDDRPECFNILTRGRNVDMAGTGFQPGGALELTLHADGTEPVLLGTFVADATGGFVGSVALPADATPSELAGLELVGSDPDGNVRVLVEHIVVVDDTDTCAATFDFGGFENPVQSAPSVNVMKAGRAVPLKFSLGGDEGLDIFADGSPSSRTVPCESNAAVNVVDELVTAAGGSDLTYNTAADRYTFVWKTEKAWSDTCRRLTVEFSDGSSHSAIFEFS